MVGNTHILFNPKRGDIKMAQLRLLLTRMTSLAAQQSRGTDVLFLAMGDLNLAPHSPIYDFLAMGELDCLSHYKKDLSGVSY